MAKILIIRLTSLGDVIFTLPLVNTLSKENEVSYLVSEKGLEVIKNNPYIKNIHFAPLKKWRKNIFSISRYVEFFNLIKEIRSQKYDIAIDCQQMFKSLFLMLLCGAKRRITMSDAREFSILAANEFVKPRTKFRDFNYHIVERNLDFARYLGIEPDEIKFPLPNISQDKKDKIKDLMKDLDNNKKTIVLAPETTWKNKHWSTKNWSELIDYIKNDYNIVYTGINEKLHDEIFFDKKIFHINLVGKTDLEELREVFCNADLVITPDSGSANSAWATGKPAIIEIFTCTPPKRFGVYGNDKYIILSGNLDCQPCFKKKCKNKTLKCCLEPSVDTVLNNIRKII